MQNINETVHVSGFTQVNRVLSSFAWLKLGSAKIKRSYMLKNKHKYKRIQMKETTFNLNSAKVNSIVIDLFKKKQAAVRF